MFNKGWVSKFPDVLCGKQKPVGPGEAEQGKGQYSITSPRGVIAPLEVVSHLDSVQVLSACVVQTKNFMTQPHQKAANKQFNSMRTIQFEYRLQFATQPHYFQGVIHSQVQGELQDVLQEEISSLLNKRARVVPPEQSHSGFYSRYFLVPKKGTQALCPILDLHALNKYLRKYKFRMPTHSTLLKLVHPGDWFKSIDL